MFDFSTEVCATVSQPQTMSTSQLLDIIPFSSKSALNRAIRDMFQVKIDDAVIASSLDARGYVVEYHLPELESKMFVAKHDINYLEMITQYWIDRNKPAQMTPMEIIAQSALALVQVEKTQKEQAAQLLAHEAKLQTTATKVSAIEYRLETRCIKVGYIFRTDARRKYCPNLSENLVKDLITLYEIPAEHQMTVANGFDVQAMIVHEEIFRDTIQSFLEDIVPIAEGSQFYNHPDLGRRRFKA